MHDFISQQRLDSVASKLYADLRLAQSEAVKRNEKVYVSFQINNEDWCYGISLDPNCDCTQANSCQLDGNEKVIDGSQYKGIVMQKARFAGGTNYTGFDPNTGYAQAGSVKNGTVWLKSATDEQLAVVVNRLGRVRFCSPTIEKYTSQCPKAP